MTSQRDSLIDVSACLKRANQGPDHLSHWLISLCVYAPFLSPQRRGRKKKRKIERTDFVFCCPFSFHTSEAALHDNYKVYVKAKHPRQRNEKLTVGGSSSCLMFDN